MMRLISTVLVCAISVFAVELGVQDTSRPAPTESKPSTAEALERLRVRIHKMCIEGDTGRTSMDETATAIAHSTETRQAFGEVMRRLVDTYGPLRLLKPKATPESAPTTLKADLERLLVAPTDEANKLIAKIIAMGAPAQAAVASAYMSLTRPYSLALNRMLLNARTDGIAFRGQFSAVGDFGPTIRPVLTNLALAGRGAQQELGLRAIRDVVRTSDEAMRPSLQRIADGRVGGPELQIVAACILADWGDRVYVTSGIKSAEAKTGDSEASMRFTGWSLLANWHQELGASKEAAHAYDQAIKDLAAGNPRGGAARFYYNAACAHVASRNLDRAMEVLELGVARGRTDNTPLTRTLIANDPDLAPLRATPKFLTWIQKAFAAP